MAVVESLVLVAALTKSSGQTCNTGWYVKDSYALETVNGRISDSLRDLDAFLTDAGLRVEFRLSGHAYIRARKRLLEMQPFLSRRPELILDGEGGIDIEWEHADRLLMFACRANPNQTDYIYYQAGEVYGGENYSPMFAKDRLNWLLHG